VALMGAEFVGAEFMGAACTGTAFAMAKVMAAILPARPALA
jgi:hypothetical protein